MVTIGVHLVRRVGTIRENPMIASRIHPSLTAVAFGLAAAIVVASSAWAQSVPNYAALLAAPDRSDGDRQADQRRDPLPFLAFADVRPGMKVLDMGAGGGYSTELLARAVAPNGVVYGQNPADLGDKAKAAFAARLASPAMKNAVADVTPFDDRCRPASTISI